MCSLSNSFMNFDPKKDQYKQVVKNIKFSSKCKGRRDVIVKKYQNKVGML